MRLTMRTVVVLISISISMFLAASVAAGEPVRLDATTADSAKASFDRMHDAATPAKRQQLVFALLKINLAGVKSAHEVAGNPQFAGGMGVERIRDKVAGMTADEIIAYGDEVSTIRIEAVQPSRQ